MANVQEAVILTGKEKETQGMKQYTWWLLAVSVLGFGSLGFYKPVLAPYLKELGFSASAIGITVGLLGFSKSLTNIPAGIWSDKIGRKPVALIGLIILGLCYPFYLISKSIYLLSVARLLQGIGNSAAAQSCMTAAADLLGKRRAFGMGIFEAVNYIAITGGTLLAGYMAQNYGIISVFYLGLPVCLLGALVIKIFARESRPAVLDPTASMANAVASPVADAECQKPLDVWKKLLANPSFASMCFLGFMTKMTDEGVLVTLIPLVAVALGFSVAEVAGIMAAGYLTFSLVQPVVGIVSDKIGRKPMFIVGLLLLLTASLLFPYAKTYLVFMAIVVILKFGNALLYPALPAAAVDVSPVKFRGTGLSVYRVFRDAGVFGGPILAGILLDVFGKANSFYALGGLFGIGLILAIAFIRETMGSSAH